MALSESPVAPLCIRLFGVWEICSHGAPLPRPRLRKGQWLLALITIRGGAEVDRSWLARSLWPDSCETQALRSLRRCLTDLRQALGPEAARLRSPTAHTLALDLAGAEVDLLTFDAAVARTDVPSLERAVVLYRGPLLEECAEEWVFLERQLREQAYLQSLETLGAHALAVGDAAGAVLHLRRVVATDPLRESAQRALMQALAATGNCAAATESYRDLRLLLHREVNAEPDAETTALYRRIHTRSQGGQGVYSAGSRSSPGPGNVASTERGVLSCSTGASPEPQTPIRGRSSAAVPATRHHILPTYRTPLLGRTEEIAVVCDLLRREEVSLITLSGPAGTGKTRLGLKVAAELLDDFADGVFFVYLAPVSDPERVLSAIAQTLRIQETVGQYLVEYLREKQLLLLLDNFEHVLPAAALVAELLVSCPGLKVLVTSRTVLHMRGEKEFSVPPLALPDPTHLPSVEMLTQYSAVQLFIQRALDVKPDFVVTRENAPAVAEICLRLDGLPLAIELAAARSKVLSPPALLSRLEQRLPLLTGGARDLPSRHQSLRDAIAWSYGLLDAGEQALFRQLSVFSGGCTVAGAAAVCRDGEYLNLDPGLPANADPIPNPTSSIRYWNTLDGLASLVDKSLLRYDDRAGAEPRFMMLETIREYGLECLETNGEAAAVRDRHASFFLAWAEQQMGLIDRLEGEYANLRAALAWCRKRGEAERAFCLGRAVWWVCYGRGRWTEGREELAALLTLEPAGQSSLEALLNGRAALLRRAGQLAWLQGDYIAARSMLEESLRLYRERGDRENLPATLNALGEVARTQGEYETARVLFEESLAIVRAQGDRSNLAWALQALGEVAREHGDADGRGLVEESLALFQEIGEQRGIAYVLSDQAEEARTRGDLQSARRLHTESLAIERAVGNKGGMARSLGYLGALVAEQAEYEEARALFEECLNLQQELGDRRSIAMCLEQLAGVAVGSANWGRRRGGKARRMGRLNNAVAVPGCCVASPVTNLSRAVQLLGAAQSLRQTLGAPMRAAERAAYDQRLAVVRAALGEAAFTTAWAVGRTMSIEQAVRTALEAGC